jgi:hypothetical protein
VATEILSTVIKKIEVIILTNTLLVAAPDHCSGSSSELLDHRSRTRAAGCSVSHMCPVHWRPSSSGWHAVRHGLGPYLPAMSCLLWR